jgi:phospholipid/cholesterol/gamma-HCH transport system ATP-binding protein
MDAALRFDGAVLPPVLEGASHAFEKGTVSAIVVSGEDDSALLVRVMTGLARLREGAFSALGRDLGTLARDELDGVRRRIGIVHPDGGLISNLKVLENVTLPLLYHSSESSREIDERAIAILGRLGFRENLFELPGRLSTFRRRMTGFARVVAAEPEVAVYNRIDDGLRAEEWNVLLEAALAFHKGAPERTTVFLSSRTGSFEGAGPIAFVRLREGRFE